MVNEFTHIHADKRDGKIMCKKGRKRKIVKMRYKIFCLKSFGKGRIQSVTSCYCKTYLIGKKKNKNDIEYAFEKRKMDFRQFPHIFRPFRKKVVKLNEISQKSKIDFLIGNNFFLWKKEILRLEQKKNLN